MRNWFRGLKLNQKFTVTTLIFIFIPLFGMMCFGFRSIKKNAIDHGVNEAVTATDLTCAEVNAKANACSMVVDTLQEYDLRYKKRRFPFDDLCTGTAGSKRRKAWRDRGIHAYGRHISRNLSIR